MNGSYEEDNKIGWYVMGKKISKLKPEDITELTALTHCKCYLSVWATSITIILCICYLVTSKELDQW